MRVPTPARSNWRTFVRLSIKAALVGTVIGCGRTVLPSQIELTPRVYRSLQTHYQKIQIDQRTEFFFCLLGHVSGNAVIVDSLVQPKIEYAALTTVHPSSNACRMNRVVGWTHSHPTREQYAETLHCYHSDLDWGYWRHRQDRFMVAIVVCEDMALNAYFRWEIPGNNRPPPTPTSTAALEPEHIPLCHESFYVIMC